MNSKSLSGSEPVSNLASRIKVLLAQVRTTPASEKARVVAELRELLLQMEVSVGGVHPHTRAAIVVAVNTSLALRRLRLITDDDLPPNEPVAEAEPPELIESDPPQLLGRVRFDMPGEVYEDEVYEDAATGEDATLPDDSNKRIVR